MSNLSKWQSVDFDQDPAPPHDDLHKELARLRRENEILRQEHDLLKIDKKRLIKYQFCRMPSSQRRVSLSAIGSRAANAIVETFFKTLKSKLVWRMTFHSRAQALSEIGQYIDGFWGLPLGYNPVRRHSAFEYTIPIKYEMIKN